MNKERILTPATVAAISLLHFGLLALMVYAYRPPPDVINPSIEFVELGDFGGGDGSPEGAGGSPAPKVETPPPQPERPKPQPKVERVQPNPEPVSKVPDIKPVVSKKAEADIVQTPKPKPVEKAKPIEKPVEKVVEKPKPVEKPTPAPVAKTNESSAEKSAAVADAKGKGDGAQSESKGKGHGTKGEGEGRGLAKDGSGSGGKEGESGSGTGGSGGGNGPGSSRGNPKNATGHLPTPPYPPLSEENAEEGTVVLNILVNPSGSVVEVNVAKSSGFSRLDKAAKAAAHNGNFNSGGSWVNYRVAVNFRL